MRGLKIISKKLALVGSAGAFALLGLHTNGRRVVDQLAGEVREQLAYFSMPLIFNSRETV